MAGQASGLLESAAPAGKPVSTSSTTPRQTRPGKVVMIFMEFLCQLHRPPSSRLHRLFNSIGVFAPAPRPMIAQTAALRVKTTLPSVKSALRPLSRKWNGIHVAALPNQINPENLARNHLAGLAKTAMG